VVDVDAQDALELATACDEEPVEAVTADAADPAFGERVCLRRAKRSADDPDASLRKTSSNAWVNLLSRVVDQKARRCRSLGE
jgi:hypothetical protein